MSIMSLPTSQHWAEAEVMKHLDHVQSSDEEKGAYEEWMRYGEMMKHTDQWARCWAAGGGRADPARICGYVGAEVLEREDLNEMFDDMDVFEKDLNLQLQLRVPHEFRRCSCASPDEMSSSDTMTTEVRVSKRGDKYWTGDSNFGKVFIPMDLVHHIRYDAAVKMRVKVMGPHVQIPLRAFFIHRNQ